MRESLALSCISIYSLFNLRLIFFGSSYGIFLRVHVPRHTDYTAYSEHRSAFERVTKPWIYLSDLLFRRRAEILLSHIDAYDSSDIGTFFCISGLRYEFGTNCPSWMRLVSYQWVSDHVFQFIIIFSIVNSSVGFKYWILC